MAQKHAVFSAWLHMTARAVEADYVIIDLGPSANRFNKTILMSCDFIVPPVYADFFSLNSATHLLKTVLPSTMQLHAEALLKQNQTRAGAKLAGVQLAKSVALGLNMRPTFQPKLLPFVVSNFKTHGNAPVQPGVTPAPIVGQPGVTPMTMLAHLHHYPAHAVAAKRLTTGPGKFVASMRNLVDNLQPNESPEIKRVIDMMVGDPPTAVLGGDGTMYLQRSMVIPLIRTLPGLVADSQYFGVPMVSMTREEWVRQDPNNPGLNQIIKDHPQDGQNPKAGLVLAGAVVDHLYARGRFAQLCSMLESLPAP